MRLTKTLSLTPLAALLAAAGLLGAALPARATAVVDGLTAEAFAQAGSEPLSSDGPNSSSTYVSAYAESSSDVGHSFNTAYGGASGGYETWSSSAGVAQGQALFTRTWQITNDTSTAQEYSFSFYVYSGFINAHTAGAIGSGWSSFLLDIALDGTELFSSYARINSDGTYSESGTQLSSVVVNDSAVNASYSWSGTALTLDLGVFNPGESRLLSYDMVSQSFGNYGYVEECGDGYGLIPHFDPEVPVNEGYGCYRTYGGSTAYTGDPSAISGTPLTPPTITARAANDVPEPGTLALLGLGLTAALGLRPRRRRD